jgi:hypothetical protein
MKRFSKRIPISFSYAFWGMSVAITNSIWGAVFLNQYPNHPWVVATGVFLCLVAFFMAIQLNERIEETHENLHRGWFLALVLVAVVLSVGMFFGQIPFEYGMVLGSLCMGMWELIGVPFGQVLEHMIFQVVKSKLISYPVAYFAAFSPAVVIYMYLLHVNGNYLLPTNILGNSGTTVLAVLWLPILYGTAADSKRVASLGTWLTIALSIGAVALVKLGF